MRDNVKIEIYGELYFIAPVWELALKVVTNSPHSMDTFLSMLDNAEADESPLVLRNSWTSAPIEEITDLCRKADLPYVVTDAGYDGLDRVHSWHPGMLRERHFRVDETIHLLDVEAIEEALALGIDPVTALVEEAKNGTYTGEIKFAPGFRDEFSKLNARDWPEAASGPRP